MNLELRSKKNQQRLSSHRTKAAAWEDNEEPTSFLIPHRPLWEDIVLATVPNVLTICFQEVVANLKAKRRRKMRQELNSHPLAGEILTTDGGHSYLISSSGMLEEVELTESEPEEEDVGLLEATAHKQHHQSSETTNNNVNTKRKQRKSKAAKSNTNL